MEYKISKNKDKIYLRIDPGEEVLESLKEIRKKENIENGFLFGIGAVNKVKLGHYNVKNQEYKEKEITGQFEVSNFKGNIGPDKIHTHITIADDKYKTRAGHCSEAVVSGTFEIIIFLGETKLNHKLDKRTGLDVFDL